MFSTTSTLSAGSTGSQARLIQSSHAPETFQPMHTEELGKLSPSSTNKKTIHAQIHSATLVAAKATHRSPKKEDTKNHIKSSMRKTSPNHSRKSSPNQSKKSSPSQSRRSSPNKARSDSVSPRNSRRSSPKTHRKSRESSPNNKDTKSPKKMKSSLKTTPSRSLSIDNPTCVECYLQAKTDKG